MNPETLNKFLASVRRTRFVDYLDPIGVTPEEALAQRLRWARRNLDDPRHQDEARFLVDHEHHLTEVLRREKAVDADDEWTDVFAAVKADSPLLTWMRRDEVTGPEPTADATARRDHAPAHTAAEEPHLEALHLTRLEDITPPPMEMAAIEKALEAELAARGEDVASAGEVRAADEEASDAATVIVDRDKLGIPARLPTPTPAPAARSGVPAPRRPLPTPTPSARLRSSDPAPSRPSAPTPVEAEAHPWLPLVGGAAAIVFAGVAGWFFLFGGPTDEPAPAGPPVVVRASVSAVPAADPKPATPVAATEPAAATEAVAAAEPVPEAIVAAEPSPEPVVATEPVADAEPSTTDAVADATDKATLPAPKIPSDTPTPRPADMPDLTGRWAGEADGAPLALDLSWAGGPRLKGSAEISTPDGPKRIPLTGSWKDGKAELSGRGDALLYGYLGPAGGNGTILFPGMDPMGWTVGPR